MLNFVVMSTEGSSGPKKINLRRPDIMAAVQAQVLSHYRSALVERIRANGHILSAGDMTIKLAKEFGFCYGVERAIDLAYAARRAYPEKRIFLLNLFQCGPPFPLIHRSNYLGQVCSLCCGDIQIGRRSHTSDAEYRIQL